jgi:hypothetical protein
VPPATENPLAGLGLFRRVADHANDVVPAGRCGELEVFRRVADAGEVHVRVDEAGSRQRAFQIDDARARADIRLNLLVRSDRGDRVAADGERLGGRPRLVDRDDLPVAQHEVGGPDSLERETLMERGPRTEVARLNGSRAIADRQRGKRRGRQTDPSTHRFLPAVV